MVGLRPLRLLYPSTFQERRLARRGRMGYTAQARRRQSVGRILRDGHLGESLDVEMRRSLLGSRGMLWLFSECRAYEGRERGGWRRVLCT